MLTQRDIDDIAYRLHNNQKVFIYYVAHKCETREGYLDEYIYKSVPDFTTVQIEVTGVDNAYNELLKFRRNPSEYHVEEETTWLDFHTKYINYYTVPNTNGEFNKAFNANIPSIIFGKRRKVYKNGELVKDNSDPSMVKEIYTNVLEWSDLRADKLLQLHEAGDLAWKYIDIGGSGKEVDGINYKYLTSDYYILDVNNFPRSEKPLINVKQNTAYFMTHEAAQYAIEQLKA